MFPRDWTYSQNLEGTAPSITIPAIPRVAHVLTGINAGAYTANAGEVPAVVDVAVYFGATLIFALYITIPAINQTDSASWSGELVAPVDTPVTVMFQGTAAAIVETLQITGYEL